MNLNHTTIIIVDLLAILLLLSIVPIAMLMQKTIENNSSRGYRAFGTEHELTFTPKRSTICDAEDDIRIYGTRNRQYTNILEGKWHGVPLHFATRTQILGGPHSAHGIPMSMVVIEAPWNTSTLMIMHQQEHGEQLDELFRHFSNLYRKSNPQKANNETFDDVYIMLGEDAGFAHTLLNQSFTDAVLIQAHNLRPHPMHYAITKGLFIAFWEGPPRIEELHVFLNAITLVFQKTPHDDKGTEHVDHGATAVHTETTSPPEIQTDATSPPAMQ